MAGLTDGKEDEEGNNEETEREKYDVREGKIRLDSVCHGYCHIAQI